MAGESSIALHLLDEPDLAARTEMSDAGLRELADSIKDVGLIHAITVKRKDGGRFEVVAGHRRLMACRQLGLHLVRCNVVEAEAEAEAVKVHENAFREDLHPLDEANHYAGLYFSNGEDIERVAALVHRNISHVDARMALLKLDERVRKALRVDLISLGVAHELGKMANAGDVAFYLEHAIQGGCSVPMMRQWRKTANARREMEAVTPISPEAAAAGQASSAPPAPLGPDYVHFARPHELSQSTAVRDCVFCHGSGEEWQGVRLYSCRPCATRYLVPREEADIAAGERRR